MQSAVNQLTGLPNRTACLADTTAVVEGARVNAQRVTALWLDLDRFLAINRSLGHQAGDQVIRMIAARIQTHAAAYGTTYNVGADEFVILACGHDHAESATLAAQLVRLIDTPLELGTVVLHPTCSIGVAEWDGNENCTGLLERADRAMHDAKQQGGNRAVFSGEERVLGRYGILLEREEFETEADLHIALDNGGLSLHYQPIINRDGQINAVEALMRCSVNGRTLSPAKLIPVAEKTGLIGRLGEWSMVTAAEFARELQQLGFELQVAVNISRVQLLTPGFSESVAAALLVADIQPGRLELEITESLFMDMSADVRSNLDACVQLGNPMSIDDFGTGYSCLATLKDLPATKLKLDRAFASVLPEDRRAFAVARAMTQLGKELGMTVVAEGVETEAQLGSMWEAGVDAVQGYCFARPMPGDALIAWLRERHR